MSAKLETVPDQYKLGELVFTPALYEMFPGRAWDLSTREGTHTGCIFWMGAPSGDQFYFQPKQIALGPKHLGIIADFLTARTKEEKK